MGNTKDRIAADLAANEIETEIDAQKQASAIIIAEEGRWYTAIKGLVPLNKLPACSPIGLVGGRSIEKVARVFAGRS